MTEVDVLTEVDILTEVDVLSVRIIVYHIKI